MLGLAAKESFDDEAAEFQAEPYADAKTFRASLHFYETLLDPSLATEPLLLGQKVLTDTLMMFGALDSLRPASVCRRAEIAYPNLVGPFLVPECGHFVSWERPAILNNAITSFCRDLLGAAHV